MLEDGYISLSVYIIFVFFHQCLIVFCIQSLVSLGRFIPRYFVLSVAAVNGIISLILFSDLSLLPYRYARDFHVLILYPATLLNSSISSHRFLMGSLGFSVYSISFSANGDRFTSFVSNLDFSYFFLFSDCHG